MKYRILLLSFLLLGALACDNEFNTPHDCIETTGIEGSNWFQEYTAQFEDDTTGFWYMSVATYKFQTVFLPGNCCPYCATIPSVLNCEGEQIGTIGTNDGQIHPDELENVEVFWRSPNYSCGN